MQGNKPYLFLNKKGALTINPKLLAGFPRNPQNCFRDVSMTGTQLRSGVSVVILDSRHFVEKFGTCKPS